MTNNTVNESALVLRAQSVLQLVQGLCRHWAKLILPACAAQTSLMQDPVILQVCLSCESTNAEALRSAGWMLQLNPMFHGRRLSLQQYSYNTLIVRDIYVKEQHESRHSADCRWLEFHL